MAEQVPLRLREDEACMEPAVTLEAFAGQTNAVAVRIEPGEDTRELLPHLERLRRIDIAFPAFTDGRGYSAARILREAGFTGELRAVGDVLVDQIAYMRRCGFDAFDPDAPLDPKDVEAALNRFPQVYQSAADARTPIWSLRHQ
ncbi:MAG: oxidoreductase [Citromicrobium sp.]|mgnify:CR=1 FL=1|nr:oxidoreductase [Citromicrobium sp.]